MLVYDTGISIEVHVVGVVKNGLVSLGKDIAISFLLPQMCSTISG